MLPLVCLPGLLCDAGIFDPLRTALAKSVTDLRAMDLPSDDSFDSLVAQIAADLPPHSALLGMSMGSYLALALAVLVPDKMAGLVLIGTNAAADSPRAAALRGKVTAWAAREGMPALAASIADSMLSPARRTDADLRAVILQMAEATGLETFTAHQTALAARPDQTSQLAVISCPVLVLTGSEDTITPPATGRAVAEGVSNGRFVLLDGVGHMPILEQPALVARHLEPFLTDICTETAQ